MSIGRWVAGARAGLMLSGLLAVLAGLTGCHATYVSTPELPATLWLKDVNTGGVIWSMDVPVQHKLSVKFDHEGGGGRNDANGKALLMAVQSAEKFPQNYTLEVTNPGGHSSRPVKKTASRHSRHEEYVLCDFDTQPSTFVFPIL